MLVFFFFGGAAVPDAPDLILIDMHARLKFRGACECSVRSV